MSIPSRVGRSDVSVVHRGAMARAILTGGLIAGALDITDAFVTNFVVAAQPSPVRVLQGVASGLLGPAAFDGGLGAAALGLACHFTIALGAAAVYVLASRVLPVLRRHPVACGLAFGLVVYLVMRHVVLPLSAVRLSAAPTPLPLLVNQWLIHAFGIGLPIALAARRYLPVAPNPPGDPT